MSAPNRNVLWGRAIVDELARSGVGKAEQKVRKGITRVAPAKGEAAAAKAIGTVVVQLASPEFNSPAEGMISVHVGEGRVHAEPISNRCSR